MKIANAGNTLAPAWLALQALGYSVSKASKDGSLLCATRRDVELIAEDPLQLLGLASLVEVRGTDWQATDTEIDEYLARFEDHSP